MLHELNPRKLLQKFRQHIVAIAADVKIRIQADQTASDLAKPGRFVAVLIFQHDLDDLIFDLLPAQALMRQILIRRPRILLLQQDVYKRQPLPQSDLLQNL